MQWLRPYANPAVWLLVPIAFVLVMTWWPRDGWLRPWLWLPIPILALSSNLVWPRSKTLKVTAIIALWLLATFLQVSAYSDIERRYRYVTRVFDWKNGGAMEDGIRMFADTRRVSYETFNRMVFGYTAALLLPLSRPTYFRDFGARTGRLQFIRVCSILRAEMDGSKPCWMNIDLRENSRLQSRCPSAIPDSRSIAKAFPSILYMDASQAGCLGA
jgi:hypothetical protein